MDRSHKVYISSTYFPIVLLCFLPKTLSNRASHRTLKNYRKTQPNSLLFIQIMDSVQFQCALKIIECCKDH